MKIHLYEEYIERAVADAPKKVFTKAPVSHTFY